MEKKQKNSLIITCSAIGVLVCAVSFYGGIKYQENKVSQGFKDRMGEMPADFADSGNRQGQSAGGPGNMGGIFQER